MVAAVAEMSEVVDRLESMVEDLDETVRRIRSVIFEPVVRFDGPIDSLVDSLADDGIAQDVLAVLRESLSNVARHAEASSAAVSLSTKDGWLELRVTDDGKGAVDDGNAITGGRGLENIRTRAARLGGRTELSARAGGGTIVTWRVPLV
jgi:signal transduction histidine kinase